MQRFIVVLSTLILIGFVAHAWAGPAEEVAQISGARGQAFEEGTVDAYSADFADNAAVIGIPSWRRAVSCRHSIAGV